MKSAHVPSPIPSNKMVSPAPPVLVSSLSFYPSPSVIWDLSDMDNDGMLDLEEFTVAMHLCDRTKAGEPLPDGLPRNMVPPSKASLMF